MAAYCSCESSVMDPEHDAGCRRCGLPVDFSAPYVCPACAGTFVTIGRLSGPAQPDDQAACDDCGWQGWMWEAAAAAAKTEKEER